MHRAVVTDERTTDDVNSNVSLVAAAERVVDVDPAHK